MKDRSFSSDNYISRVIRMMASVIVVLSLILVSCLVPGDAFAAIEPTLTAESGIVYCENTGEVVFTKDPDKKMSPYSVTKLMTAIVERWYSPRTRIRKCRHTVSQS